MTQYPTPWRKTPDKMTEKERIAALNSVEGLRELEYDLRDALNRRGTFPGDWNHIAEGLDRDAARVKVTIRLDADVVKFFRLMGPGYQTRINRVLRSYMQARVAGILEG
ncbi:MAG: BrnA antitoxin family protein [Pseudomonadota bacterium]